MRWGEDRCGKLGFFSQNFGGVSRASKALGSVVVACVWGQHLFGGTVYTVYSSCMAAALQVLHQCASGIGAVLLLAQQNWMACCDLSPKHLASPLTRGVTHEYRPL